MTPLLKTTGWWIWSEENDSSSGIFNFEDGGRNPFFVALAPFRKDKRAFAVRSAKR